MPKFPKQAQQIKTWMEPVHVDIDQLAEMIYLKPTQAQKNTLRKYVAGSNVAGESAMRNIRIACLLAAERLERDAIITAVIAKDKEIEPFVENALALHRESGTDFAVLERMAKTMRSEQADRASSSSSPHKSDHKSVLAVRDNILADLERKRKVADKGKT
jgi:hypothetical protein